MFIRLTLLLFVFTGSLSAQVEYGKITYLQTSEAVIDINLGDDEEEDPGKALRDKQIKEMFAKMKAGGAFDKNYAVTFTPSGFSCQEVEKETQSQAMESGGMTIIVETGGGELTHHHTDTETGSITNKVNIADRTFLVTGTPAPIRWELTGEKIAPSEMTAGLDLLVAVGITETNDTITAGYAPSLPVQVGPQNYYGLPGAIITLEVPRGKEKTVYRATSIELSPSPLDVSKPTEGKAISLEKYRKEVEKRRKTEIRMFGN